MRTIKKVLNDGWIRRHTFTMFQGHGNCLPEGPTGRSTDIPAFIAALEAYGHEGEAEDASRLRKSTPHSPFTLAYTMKGG